MPDAFFTSSKPRKRKRLESDSGPQRHSKGTNSKPSSKNVSFERNSGKKTNSKTPKSGNSLRKRDEELSDGTDVEGGDIDDLDLRIDDDEEPALSDEEDPDEAPAEKRLRLAKLYLESVKESLADGEFDAAEIDKELISARLKQDVMEHSGKIHLFLADNYEYSHPHRILHTRGHRFSITSAVASENGAHLFTAGKEGSIIKWNLATGKKLTTFYKHKKAPTKVVKGKSAAPPEETDGHTDEVLALAVSWDGKYLASAGRDRKLILWDVHKEVFLKSFGGHLGHKDVISCISFRKNTHQLYTASHDRTIKLYDLSPSVLGYVETLFGHQDHVLALDSLRGETCVSAGGRDKTVRYWKVADETQLVFRGGGRSRVREVLEGEIGGAEDEEAPRAQVKKFVEGSMECVAMVDETTFLSGGDSGSISLWSTLKKKPTFTQALAHGLHQTESATEGIVETPRWITAIACLRYSDLFVSGSWDGTIRIWKIDSKQLKSFSLVGTIPALGVVNSLQLISPPAKEFTSYAWPVPVSEMDVDAAEQQAVKTPVVVVVAGMGQEHRLGRWLKIKDGAVNGTVVIELTPKKAES